MERKVTKLESCHVQVDVVVDKDSWKQAQDKAFKKLAANLTVDGFRKGKVPEAIARKHIDQVKLLNEAINSVLPVVYQDILTNEKIAPFAQPSVDITKVSDDELEVKFVIVTAPEVKLGKYKGLNVGKKEAKVTAKEVNEAIDGLRAQSASLVLKEAESALGDTVVFDFVGTVDGVAFEGGTAQNYSLELGSNTFIPGFEDQLVGLKAGDHKDVHVTFPEAYTPELAGKAAVFACDIHEVKEKKLPELNEEFVKELGIKDVETVEALKENKKAELLDRKSRELRTAYLHDLYDAIAKDSTIEIPDEMVQEQAESNRKDMENRMQQSGLTFEQYLGFMGQTEEEFMKKVTEDSRRDIRNYFILEEVVKLEELEVSDADLEFEFAKLAEQYNMKIDDVKKHLEKQVEQFRHNLKMTRIEDLLLREND